VQVANGQSAARRADAAQPHERDERHRAIGAAAGRIEIDRAFTPGLDAEQAVGHVRLVVGEITDDRDLQRAAAFLFAVVRPVLWL
jgi:hypothetical protein